MQHLLIDNFALVFTRGQAKTAPAYSAFVSATLVSCDMIAPHNSVAPLYLYNEDYTARTPNFDATILSNLSDRVGRQLTPEEVFDYVYGVLHQPSYLQHYAEFLKVDYPRISYPNDAQTFDQLRNQGTYLRQLHLMQGAEGWQLENDLQGDGDLLVDRPNYREGRIYINKNQYFAAVDPHVWAFYIGGYQPAQKWLKDRHHQHLTFAQILHYQRILHVLAKTSKPEY